MSGGAIEAWLALKQRKALLSARVYFITAAILGTGALLPVWVFSFMLNKLLLLLALPHLQHVNLCAGLIMAAMVPLLFADFVRAERYDMGIIPLWLAREYLHAGPRFVADGWQRFAAARRFGRIDRAMCAEVLVFLTGRSTSVSRREFAKAYPLVSWVTLVPQLREIPGVIVFRDGQHVSLLSPLRNELRRLLPKQPRTEAREEETVAAEGPQNLSAHEILGVATNASLSEIKAAYRTRVKECHPDRFQSADEHSRKLAEEWTKSLNAAYAELVRAS